VSGGPPAGAADAAAADTPESARHVKPFVLESAGAKTLYFSMDETQSRMKTRDPFALALEYTRTMMGALLLMPQPARIGMVGLGGGSLAKFCHRHLPAARIEVVEINPHVIALRDEFHVPPDDARLQVHRGDGALFIRQCASRFDLLFIDGFDRRGMPARLSSQRFYDDCFEALCPQGIAVVNLYRGDPRYDIFLDRIRRSFDDSVLVVDDKARCNSIVFGCKGEVLTRLRSGRVRPEAAGDAPGGAQRAVAFARVAAALKSSPN
jgi:spermidine synthase